MLIALIALVAVLGVVLAACNESTTSDPAGSIDYEVRQNVTLAFMIMMLVAGIALIVVVMMQKGTNDNVGVITGASDTYYGRNKEKGKESVLKKVTFALFAFILVCSIICFVVGTVDLTESKVRTAPATGAVFICPAGMMRIRLGTILFGAFPRLRLANM